MKVHIGLRPPSDNDEGWVDRQLRTSELMAGQQELERTQRRIQALQARNKTIDPQTLYDAATLTRNITRDTVEFLADYVGTLTYYNEGEDLTAVDPTVVDPTDDVDRAEIIKALRRSNRELFMTMLQGVQAGNSTGDTKSD